MAPVTGDHVSSALYPKAGVLGRMATMTLPNPATSCAHRRAFSTPRAGNQRLPPTRCNDLATSMATRSAAVDDLIAYDHDAHKPHVVGWSRFWLMIVVLALTLSTVGVAGLWRARRHRR